MGLITSALAALLLATQVRAANPTGTPVEAPAAKPTLNAPTVHGCFSSSGTLTSLGTLTFNSIGGCAKDTCFKNGKKVGGTSNGAECYCGDTYPPLDTLVEDSKCDIACTGYPFEVCGGLNYYTIYNTGVALGVPYDANGTAPGTPSSSPAPNPPTDAKGAPTVVVTAPPPGTPQTQSGSGGASSTNVGGIVAGVVVGIAVVFGIAGGIFFFLRRRRNKEIEEEHRHNAAVNAFINGSKPPGSSGGVSVSDARLDPVMAQRRLSSGSIADNADYSRKILRVTNA